MAKARITKRSVDATKAAARNVFLWDDEISGFGLKTTPAGRKVYIYQYRLALPGEASVTPPRRYTIGAHGEWTPDKARERARKLRSAVEQGIDPVDARRDTIAAIHNAKRQAAERARQEAEWDFERIAERWLIHLREAKKSNGYYITSRWAVRNYLVPKLAGKPLPHVQPDDIQAIISAVQKGMAQTALAVFDTAFAIFKWAKSTSGGRIVSHNIVEDVDRPRKPDARERVLADSELALIWRASGQLSGPWPSFYRLAILTGKRRAELSEMDWSELDRGAQEWVIPKDRTKNRNIDVVPLSDAAMAELASLAHAARERASLQDADIWPKNGPVLTANGAEPIGNFSKMKRVISTIIAKANDGDELPHWTFHDLRRTFASGLQRLGVRFEVTEALLAHTGRSRAGVVGIYQRHDWKPEKRDALDKWSAHIAQIVAASASSNVVSLNERRA